MLSAAVRARFVVVLVGARNPHNIGAAARAMRDFGFTDLRIVTEYAAPFEAARLEATNAAVASKDILRAALAFTSLADALADCTLAVGTTAIGARTIEHKLLPLLSAAPKLLDTLHASEAARVALLFGSEKTGLTNEQLSHCAWLTTIPMLEPVAAADGTAARHLSMNLGQSVAVCLYELVRAGFEGSKQIPVATAAPATGEDRERLAQLLLDVMHVTEYTRRFPANAQEPTVRQLTQALGKDHSEAETWMGIFRQVLWSARQKEKAPR